METFFSLSLSTQSPSARVQYANKNGEKRDNGTKKFSFDSISVIRRMMIVNLIVNLSGMKKCEWLVGRWNEGEIIIQSAISRDSK